MKRERKSFWKKLVKSSVLIYLEIVIYIFVNHKATHIQHRFKNLVRVEDTIYTSKSIDTYKYKEYGYIKYNIFAISCKLHINKEER